MNSRYIVTIESENVYGEVWVNRIPIGTISPSENSPFAFPVNEYIVTGENKIGIMIHSGPNPSTSDKPWGSDPKAHAYTGPAKLAMKFSKFAPEEVPFRETPPALVSIDWHGQAVAIPAFQEKAITLPHTFDPPLWTTAQVFTSLDVALHNEAIEYLHSLYTLLAEHKFDAYIELSKPRLDLMTGAYGVPLEPLLQQMRTAMHEASQPPFHLIPFDPKTIDLRLVADGRLIDVNRVGRGYVFDYVKPGSDEELFFPVRIGKQAGKWMMLA